MSIDRRTLLKSAAALSAAAWSSVAVARAIAGEASTSPAGSGQPTRPSSAAAAGESLRGLMRTPHTRFVANLELWWGKLPFIERFRAAAALGFSAVEFWPWQGKDIAAIASITKELVLTVAQFGAWSAEPALNDPKNRAAFIAAIEESCGVARRLGAKAMCVHGGVNTSGLTREQMHANIIAALKEAAPIAEKSGVTLLLEPMNNRVDHRNTCLTGSEAPVRICRAVGSPNVKVLWDLYHVHIEEGDLCGHLRDGFDQLGYVHLADYPGRHEPGTGEINYRRILQELHQLGYRGYVGVECRPATDEATAARAVAAMDTW
jgi:hydroxypyruvate isomerase